MEPKNMLPWKGEKHLQITNSWVLCMFVLRRLQNPAGFTVWDTQPFTWNNCISKWLGVPDGSAVGAHEGILQHLTWRKRLVKL